jgi:hypothetical protein
MVRIFLTIVLPLLLPTALYLLWLSMLGAARGGGAAVAWGSLPWVWLVGVGAVLLAAVLLVVTVGFGTRQEGVYVAPRYQNGRIIPGHIEPQAPR